MGIHADAGRKALTERDRYDMEPVNGGLCEPGFTVIPLPAKQRKRKFDAQYNTGQLQDFLLIEK